MKESSVIKSACAAVVLTATVFIIGACTANLKYDTSEGIDGTVRLFEEEISVPVGDIGPISVGYLLGQSETISELLNSLLTIGEDGSFGLASSDVLFTESLYLLKDIVEDPSQPYSWNAGSKSASIGGAATMLGLVGLQCREQKLNVQASNPMWDKAVINTSVTAQGIDYSTYQTATAGPCEVKDYQLTGNADKVVIAELQIPEDLTVSLSSVYLNDLQVDLPANFPNTISKKINNNITFYYDYKSSVAVGPKFNLPLNLPVKNLSIPLGQYELKKCNITLDIESTIPIDVQVNRISVLKPKYAEDGSDDGTEPDTNIVISSGFTVLGGTMEFPTTTPLTFTIEALEGTVPDLKSLEVDIALSAPTVATDTKLSAKQGISIKSAAATLSGGITLFNNQDPEDEN